MNAVRRFGTSIVWVGTALLTFAGCHTIQTRDGMVAAPRTTGPVSRVVVLWSEAVLRQDQMPVAQGFAGKLYLFSAESDSPVTAPGKFTIYAYNDTKTANNASKSPQMKPDYTWELAESDLQQLIKKDAVGWSYSLWLPCVAPVPTERRFTVIVRFTPDRGAQIFSEATLVTLPAIHSATSLAKSQSDASEGNEPPVKLARNLITSP